MKNVLPPFLQRNKFYLFSGLFFVVWIGIIDGANLINQGKLYYKLSKIRSEITFYENELVKVKHDEDELQGNLDALEKFGRENYLMKKAGETVFVLEDKDGQPFEDIQAN